MAQHDYNIANGTGAAVRSDLNNALAAIVSQNSGATAPSTTYAYMPWADTTTGLFKIRNAANNGWITLYQLDGEWSTIALENGSAAAPSIYFKDSGTDTGVYSPGADQVAISTGGTGRLFVDSSGRVGLGTSSPTAPLDVAESSNSTVRLRRITSGNNVDINFYNPITTAGDVARIRMDGDGVSNAYGALSFWTTQTPDSLVERLRITSAGRVGIGVTGPQHLCQIAGTLAVDSYNDTSKTITLRPGFEANANGGMGLAAKDHSGAAPDGLGIYGTDGVSVHTANAGTFFERFRVDTSGRLLVGTSSARANFYNSTLSAAVQVEGTGNSAATRSLSIINNSTANDPPFLLLGKSNGSTLGSNTAVSSSVGQLGIITFQGNDGTEFVSGAEISAEVDGTSGANDLPTRLVFSTTADGASSPTERMRITQEGAVLIGKTSGAGQGGVLGVDLGAVQGLGMFQRSGGELLYLNRTTNDGTLVRFVQDNTDEGSISVSGTTVSYNGAHLSRWSQLPGGAERAEILRGTVLSNINEMCGWGEENNEQLNRMKVSDVEGDPNVAGVFQDWDDDDDTYTDDFYCAMTGDFIIRIAEGVTVQRGDLLMSAGDGTAKPQDDDIIRSKTVAKVTSNHVTCTYDDGSYCVPCVLMAC